MAQAPAPAQQNGRPRLGEMLIRDGLINAEQLARALEEQRAFGGRLGRHLVDLGFLSDAALLDALSRQLRIPRIDLEAPGAIAPDATRYVRADLAEQWGFCPVAFDQKRNVLVIAVSDPDPQLLNDVEGFLAMKVDPRIAPAEVIERVQQRLFHGDGTPVKRMAGLQIARAEAKNSNNLNDALSLGLGAPPAPPAPAPNALPPMAPSGVNPFDAQIAQQVALQQQLQAQLQQQLQLQQMQHLQMQAQQAAAQQLPPQYGAPAMPNGMAPNPMGYANGYPAPPQPQGYPNYPAQPVPPKPNGMGNGTMVGVPQAPPMRQPPPPPPPPPAQQQMRPPAAPPQAAAPQPGSLADMQDQLNRLEKTLAAQARALRSLVEVLVDKGLLTKVEMARKQQENNGK